MIFYEELRQKIKNYVKRYVVGYFVADLAQTQGFSLFLLWNII